MEHEQAAPNEDALDMRGKVLPHVQARQAALQAKLAGRSDRFSQLLSGGSQSEFIGDRLQVRSNQSDQDLIAIREAAAAAVKPLAVEQSSLIAELRSALAELDPLPTLALVSYTNVFIPYGSYFEPSHTGSETAVELVAGMLLTQPTPIVRRRPHPEDLKRLERIVTDIDLTTYLYNLALRHEGGIENELRLRTTTHWMGMRGDAYTHHARELTLAMYSPIEPWMIADIGFSIDDFFASADAMLSILEGRVNRLLHDAVESINEGGGGGPPADGSFAGPGLFDRLATAMTFTASDLVAASAGKLTMGRCKAVLDYLASPIGGLDPNTYNGLYDRSPLLARPIVHEGEHYQLPVPGHLLRSPHVLFEASLLASRNRFSRHRATVLDALAVEYISNALPGAWTATSLFYEFDDGEGARRYETDGLVLFEDYCIVVEGKAGALSVAAHRGDLVRAQRDIKRTIEDAWIQGSRVRRYLESTSSARFTDEAGATVITLDTQALSEVIVVNPLSHSLGVFGFHLPALRELGLFDADDQPWTVMVTDLMVIAEMILSPAELIHYVQWRKTLPIGDKIVTVDELDIFGAYLFGHVGREELAQDEHLFIASATTDFDEYYASATGQGPPSKKPHRVLGDLIEGHLLYLAHERPKDWLLRSFALLDLPVDEAAMVQGWLEVHALEALEADTWTGIQYGDTAIVALRADMKYRSVAEDIDGRLEPSKRLVAATVGSRGVRIVWSARL